ncbi:hypothetical protein ACFLYU_05785 [Candidatus Dependentiae bacterium]
MFERYENIAYQLGFYKFKDIKNGDKYHLTEVGFVNSDFFVDNGFGLFEYDHLARIYKFGNLIAKMTLSENSTKDFLLEAIIRGHQHSREMIKKLLSHNGIYKLYHLKTSIFK